MVDSIINGNNGNEYREFSSACHPRTSIVCQEVGDKKQSYWYIYYVSSRTMLTLAGDTDKSIAMKKATQLSEGILESETPLKTARRYAGDWQY